MKNSNSAVQAVEGGTSKNVFPLDGYNQKILK